MTTTEELDRLHTYGLRLLESIEADEQALRDRIAQQESVITDEKAKRERLLSRLSGLLEDEGG